MVNQTNDVLLFCEYQHPDLGVRVCTDDEWLSVQKNELGVKNLVSLLQQQVRILNGKHHATCVYGFPSVLHAKM